MLSVFMLNVAAPNSCAEKNASAVFKKRISTMDIIVFIKIFVHTHTHTHTHTQTHTHIYIYRYRYNNHAC